MFYIRLTEAPDCVCYWHQNAQNWTTVYANASLFASQDEAESEADYARRGISGVVEVRRAH